MKCLYYKIGLLAAAIGAAVMLIYRLTCTYTTRVSLSSSVRIVMKSRTDGYKGEFASRAIDIFVNNEFLRRVWCGPLATKTEATGVFVALCKGEFSDYVAINDHDAYWIVSLRDPRKIRIDFPEKKPPLVQTEYNVSDLGHVLSVPGDFPSWVEGLNVKRSLLEE